MRTFQDYLKIKGIKVKEDLYTPRRYIRTELEDIVAIVSNLENKDIEDNKDLLIELRKLLDKVLTGGD